VSLGNRCDPQQLDPGLSGQPDGSAGDILAIDATDLILTVLVLMGAVSSYINLRQQILLTLIQLWLRFKASQSNFIATPLSYCSLVAVAIKESWVLLVNAFLVIPASTAKLLSQHFTAFWRCPCDGAISSIAGMIVSSFNFASVPASSSSSAIFSCVYWAKLTIKAA